MAINKYLVNMALLVFLCIAGNVTAATGTVESGHDGGGEKALISTNVHFTGKFCEECHERRPEKDGDPLLRFDGDFGQLCNCHGYTSASYIHPVDVVPSAEKMERIPGEYPLRDGKLVCSTCHDMYDQCQYVPHNDNMNRKFLRGAPYPRRTTLCFRCHDESKYKMLDPHDQLTTSGDIVVEKCLYCHLEKPDERKASYEDVKLVGDLKVLCQRCHGLLDRHPGNSDHFLPPSKKITKRIKILEEKYDIVMPLDWEGKLTCVTCHNPHEKGVIPAERAGAKGADEYYRHRLPGRLCRSCHGM